MPMRADFPTADSNYLGGESDGYEYRTVFAGSSLENSYRMIREFLKEEGYGDVPLPKDAEELLLFRLPTRNRQILLFEDNGYVHNPVKILFPMDRRKRTTLILCLYNENDPQHLLRFHRVLERRKEDLEIKKLGEEGMNREMSE
ncbi:MAG: hypothetical protein SFU99_24515 [Saprospiraceae bacterium]|nr:hypothetical protein [Saprospiraceae bacterium]